MKDIRIILADDHSVVRDGFLRALEHQDNITVVGEANSGEQAYPLFTKLKADILVMNISLPSMSGLEVLRRIITRNSAAKIIMFSIDENITLATQALSIGAKAYLSMSETHTNLIEAITDVSQGQNFLSRKVAQKIALQSISGNEHILQTLSSREFEIFRLLVEGKVAENIAKQLRISQKTVANYQTILKQKLGVSGPIELVRLAIKHGVIKA